jgi:phosphate uptake regulator
METRKVQMINGTLMVSIPATYARDLKIKKGDEVIINLNTRYGRRGIQVSKSRG